MTNLRRTLALLVIAACMAFATGCGTTSVHHPIGSAAETPPAISESKAEEAAKKAEEKSEEAQTEAEEAKQKIEERE